MGEDEDAPPPNTKQSKQFNKILNSIVELIITELDKEENRVLIRQHVIHPILRLIYDEVYPYIMFVLTAVIIILLISVVILALLILFYRST